MPDRSDWLQTLEPAARFILQGGPAARASAGATFGLPLPENPCRANSMEGRAALWLGPDEHLLLGPAGDAQFLAAELSAALAGIAHSLVDISQRQIAVQVSGPRATEMLSRGCPLDLDPAEFPAGFCTRTLFGKVEIVLWRTGAEEFRLEVWRSFSDYVLECLQQAARESIAPVNIA
jgi:sarcosine oxidase, subunit gamma